MSYLFLSITALLPVIAAIILYLLERYTKYKELKPIIKQIIVGVVFGGLAVVGTEWSIPINGVNINCRDAAVLIASFFFDGWGGVIAGCIGGVERWFSVYWGVSSFTQIACSISTIIAGIYGTLIHRYMLKGRRPTLLFAFASAIVMETIHMTLIFLTNMNDPNLALDVVKTATGPMVIANAVSVSLASVTLIFINKEYLYNFKHNHSKIGGIIQEALLITVVLAYVITFGFVYYYQTSLATYQGETYLSLAIDDAESDIVDRSNECIIQAAESVKNNYGSYTLEELSGLYNVCDINVVDKNGIITESLDANNVGFDMNSGEQSSEFMVLINSDTTEYAQTYQPRSIDGEYRKYGAVKYEGGFIQVGYNDEEFQNTVNQEIKNVANNRRVGTNGYIIILDRNYNVVSAPSFVGTDISSAPHVDTDENKLFEVTVDSEKYYGMYMFAEGHYIISMIPENEVYSTRDVAIYVNSFMEILLFGLLFTVIYELIKIIVIKQLDKVNASLAKISSGDLNEVVNVKNNEEFSILSNGINETVDTLKKYIDEAGKRYDKDLELAKQIQSSALPKTNDLKVHPNFDIFASMNPAKEVGGDFYDYYFDDVNSLNILIADVSGKGIPAAMFMMKAKAELKNLTESGLPLDQVFTDGNHALCEGNDAEMFVTALQFKINVKTGEAVFVNAGHNPPLIKRKATGKFEYLKSKCGFVLAGMDGFKYKAQEFKFEPGDVIYMYTDGVTEATDANGKLLGEQLLLDKLNSCETDSMNELCSYVKEVISSFVGEADQSDDITMLAFNYIGQKPLPTLHFEETNIEDISKMTALLEQEMEKINCPMKILYQLNIAVDEIVSNIINHGYPDKKGPVTFVIDYRKDREAVYLKFVDEGIPYNPLNTAEPDVTLDAQDRKIGGLGIYMVKNTMDNIKYRYEDNQNVLTIMKKLDGGKK